MTCDLCFVPAGGEGPEETNQKLISNCSQNEIESERPEFKTLAVINIMYIIY